MKDLIIWYNPHKHSYYYKTCVNLFDKYFVGYKNQYGHEVIMVIDIYKELIYHLPFLKKVLRRLIFFLHKLEKRI